MEIFTTVEALQNFLRLQNKNQRSIGLIPTMGALHEGHISLIEAAKNENDVTVCSVFVNPTQFNNPEDLSKYPRTPEEDYQMLEVAGCDAVFAPSVDEIYPARAVLQFNFGSLETVMEGASRPGHFNGVGIVVSKLFNMVNPDRAYFGQKDLQQVAVINQLINDLSFPLKLVICPTVRESDGLAMSSRNRRLNESERNIAPHIFRILQEVRDKINSQMTVGEAIQYGYSEFGKIGAFQLDYLEFVNLNTLENKNSIGPEGTNAICVATFLGPVRLIDNVIF